MLVFSAKFSLHGKVVPIIFDLKTPLSPVPSCRRHLQKCSHQASDPKPVWCHSYKLSITKQGKEKLEVHVTYHSWIWDAPSTHTQKLRILTVNSVPSLIKERWYPFRKTRCPIRCWISRGMEVGHICCIPRIYQVLGHRGLSENVCGSK